jgi:AcrR family transcriptional regulator
MHFKNKDDIFRSMIEAYYTQSCADVAVALARGGAIGEQLKAGFFAQSGEVFKALLNSPHGAEIIDVKSAARDVVEEGNKALKRVYADWLAVQSEVGRVDHSAISNDPAEVAEVMLKALEGLKCDVPSYEDYAARCDLLAKAFGGALAS